MTFNIKKYKEIRHFLDNNTINSPLIKPTLVAVTKTRPKEDIFDAISCGVKDFGEIRVEEATNKFSSIKLDNIDIKLHMIGAVQSKKVKKALDIFDVFHSLDRKSLANEFAKNSISSNKSFFIQVNTGKEPQKSGILPNLTSDFVRYCLDDLNLNVVGLMCLPPINEDPHNHFILLKELASENKLEQLSMGMSRDYIAALSCGSTCIRIGSSLFGERK